ncbi:MAG: hypothetical protein KAG82_13960 [Alcanivoracaceae bacterium]|nr:hypothetical protein [Alcanivoracaceae bacterium]
MALDENVVAHLLLVLLCTIGFFLSCFHKAGDPGGQRFKLAAGAVIVNYMILFGMVVPGYWGKQPFVAALSSAAVMSIYLATHLFVWRFRKKQSGVPE